MPSRTDQVFFGVLRFVISFFCSHRSLARSHTAPAFLHILPHVVEREKMSPPNSNTLTNLVCVCNFPVLASTAAAAVAAYSSFLSHSLSLYIILTLTTLTALDMHSHSETCRFLLILKRFHLLLSCSPLISRTVTNSIIH